MWGSELRGVATRRRVVALAAAAALLGGCATPQLPGASVEGGARSSWLGRFAVHWTVDASPPRTEQATGRFTLADGAGRTELEVFSPFGQTVARATASRAGAVLEMADGRRYEAPDPEALTETALGWRMPVQRLPAWLLRRTPDHAVDGGWDVLVDARGDDGLPRRLTLKWPAATTQPDGRSVTIRLILDDARVEPSAAR